MNNTDIEIIQNKIKTVWKEFLAHDFPKIRNILINKVSWDKPENNSEIN